MFGGLILSSVYTDSQTLLCRTQDNWNTKLRAFFWMPCLKCKHRSWGGWFCWDQQWREFNKQSWSVRLLCTSGPLPEPRSNYFQTSIPSPMADMPVPLWPVLFLLRDEGLSTLLLSFKLEKDIGKVGWCRSAKLQDLTPRDCPEFFLDVAPHSNVEDICSASEDVTWILRSLLCSPSSYPHKMVDFFIFNIFKWTMVFILGASQVQGDAGTVFSVPSRNGDFQGN